MAVSVKILNSVIDTTTSEYIASCEFQEMLNNYFSDIPSVSGNIYITYGLTLSGQEVRDIDILVFGKLQNYSLDNYYTNDIKYPRKTLKVDEFCCAIELKNHPIDRIDYKGTHILVKYRDDWKDATGQNEQQRYSCANYIENLVGNKVFCTNFLWLRGVAKENLNELVSYSPVGALPASFNFKDMVDVIILQGLKPHYDNLDKCYHITINKDKGVVDEIKQKLFSQKQELQGLTRRKIECLNQLYLEGNFSEAKVGDSLMIFEGRAGTGKTFRLIELALRCAYKNEDRCLLLTYNHALVGDIRRLLHFMNVPDGIDTYSVQIQTLHSFFMQLMKLLGIDTSQIFGDNFDREYNKAIDALLDYVTNYIDERDLNFLKDENSLAIDWDYIFIDEAQDWTESEKQILYKVYGPSRIIVADGVDQFMRTNKRLTWKVRGEEANVIKQNKGLRQKTNLVDFVNILASELDLTWKVEPNKEDRLCGGEIIITNSYTDILHKELVDRNKRAECENYDILLLIPYQMKPAYEGRNDGIIKIDLNTWKNVGINLYDGTKENVRKQYSTDVDECRLYLYESCRGLESWVTVCLNLDVLIENKLNDYKNYDVSNNLALESPENIRRKMAYLWSLMPLTRPIDTLVITLKNPDSEIGCILKKIANQNQDYIQWRIK